MLAGRRLGSGFPLLDGAVGWLVMGFGGNVVGLLEFLVRVSIGFAVGNAVGCCCLLLVDCLVHRCYVLQCALLNDLLLRKPKRKKRIFLIMVSKDFNLTKAITEFIKLTKT